MAHSALTSLVVQPHSRGRTRGAFSWHGAVVSLPCSLGADNARQGKLGTAWPGHAIIRNDQPKDGKWTNRISSCTAMKAARRRPELVRAVDDVSAWLQNVVAWQFVLDGTCRAQSPGMTSRAVGSGQTDIVMHGDQGRSAALRARQCSGYVSAWLQSVYVCLTQVAHSQLYGKSRVGRVVVNNEPDHAQLSCPCGLRFASCLPRPLSIRSGSRK